MEKEIKNTKKFRNAVYRRALELYLEAIKNRGGAFGLCRYIANAIFELYNIEYDSSEFLPINPYRNMEVFEEIYRHKPTTELNADYWFDLRDTESRIKIFNFAIEETN